MGRGSRLPSSIYNCVFATGSPKNTGPDVDVIRLADDQIVVSVGPYIFQSDPLRLTSSLASSRGRASPPHKTLNSSDPCQPASKSSRHVAGVACIIVAP